MEKSINNKKFYNIQKNIFEKVFFSPSSDLEKNIQNFLNFKNNNNNNNNNSSSINMGGVTQADIDRVINTLVINFSINNDNYLNILTFVQYFKDLSIKSEQFLDFTKKIYPFANKEQKEDISKDIRACVKFLLSTVKIKTEKKFNKVKYLLSLQTKLKNLDRHINSDYQFEKQLTNSLVSECLMSNPNNLIEIIKHPQLLEQLFSIIEPNEIINILTHISHKNSDKILSNLNLLNILYSYPNELIDKEYLKTTASLYVDKIIKLDNKELFLTLFNRFKVYEFIINPNTSGLLGEIFSAQPLSNIILKTYFEYRAQYQNFFPVIKEDASLARKYIQGQLENQTIDVFINSTLKDKVDSNRQLVLLLAIIKNKNFLLTLEQKNDIKNKLISFVDSKDFYQTFCFTLPQNMLDSLISIRFNNFTFSNLNEAMTSLYSAEDFFVDLLNTSNSNKKDKTYFRETLYLKVLKAHLSQIKKIISSNSPQLLTVDLMKKANFTNPIIAIISPLVMTYKKTNCFLHRSKNYQAYDLVVEIINSFDNIFNPMEKINSQNGILNYITQSQGFKLSDAEEKKEIVSKFTNQKISAFEKLIKTFFNKQAYQILINDSGNKFQVITNKSELIDEQQFLERTKSWIIYQAQAEQKTIHLSSKLMSLNLVSNDNCICSDIYKNYSQIVEKIKDYPYTDPEKIYFLKNIFFDILDKVLDIYTKIDIKNLDSHNIDRVKGALSGQLISVNQELVTIYLNMTQEKEESYLKEIEIFDTYLKKKFKKHI